MICLMAYGDFKDLPGRATSNKVLHGKAINIAKDPKYDRYQRGLASIVCNVLMKGLQVVPLKMKSWQTRNQQENQTNQSLENLKNEKYA